MVSPDLELKAASELMTAVEKYSRTLSLAHCEGVFKVLDGECRDVWVTRKYRRESKASKPVQGG